MEYNAADILQYIPQRAPIVMVNNLLFTEGEITRTDFIVKADTIFVEDGFLNESGLLENIAQTAAAGAGYRAQKENRPVLKGYIGAIKNVVIFFFPKIGDQIITEVKIENQVFDVTIITGKIFCRGEVAAQCEMKIFINQL